MKTNRNELIAALEAVKPGIASKELIEQSTAFVFQAGRVYTYNDMIAVSHPCPPGLAGAVQSKELHALLKRSADDELEITTTETEMLVRGKRNKAGIALQAEITLPIAEVGTKKTWTALPEGFAAAVKFVLFSASDDMTKPWSTAVHINGHTIETCDNFRLTRYLLQVEKGKPSKLNTDVLIPALACAVLVGYAPTHYSIDDQWAHFMNKQGTEFSCRIVADKFPDLSPFVDRKWEHEIEFHADTAAILDRACVFLADKNVHPTVSIKVASGRMIVAAKGAAGWFEETVRVTASKTEFEFVIDPQALKDMLPLLKDCELSDDGSVLKFEGEAFIHCCATVVE
jgi:DNA polymerase III sliding clamp (beta) subunit (PCNA family)